MGPSNLHCAEHFPSIGARTGSLRGRLLIKKTGVVCVDLDIPLMDVIFVIFCDLVVTVGLFVIETLNSGDGWPFILLIDQG